MDHMPEINIIRSRRRTVAITVGNDGRVEVKAPPFVSEEEIRKIVLSRLSWIKEAGEEKKAFEASKKKFVTGDPFYYLGQPCTLQLDVDTARTRVTVSLKDGILHVFAGDSKRDLLRDAIRRWYIHQARMYLGDRVRFYQDKIGRTAGNIRIKEQKTRWGSCSGKGNLNFNWKIMMAPPEVADYLVVHELCHLKQMNHSREFWTEVEGILPDYKKWRKWLRENERFLDIDMKSVLK